MAEATDSPRPQRHSERQRLAIGVPANLWLPQQQHAAFVTLHDISAGGACAVRHGPFAMQPDDPVALELVDYDSGERLTIAARVRWLQRGEFTSMLGLAFCDNPEALFAFLRQHRPGALAANG